IATINETHQFIRISISLDAAWALENTEKLPTKVDEPKLTLNVDPGTATIRIVVFPHLAELMKSHNNSGERQMMGTVLLGLRDLLPAAERAKLSEEAIGKMLDLHAPLGAKKM